jgi:hypothetical protein
MLTAIASQLRTPFGIPFQPNFNPRSNIRDLAVTGNNEMRHYFLALILKYDKAL